MLKKIKDRLPGGKFYKAFITSLHHLISGKYNFADKEILVAYFLGGKFFSKHYYSKYYHYLEKKYSVGDYFNFKGIKIPKFSDSYEKDVFIQEFLDILLPVLNFYGSYLGEGPYLYHKVQIQKGDIVIDAGANIGMFSALASHLGGIVYAFEPVKEIREKYLEKTAQLNPNINIVPLALSNKNGEVKIEVDLINIGCSSIVFDRKDSIKEIVKTTTLDDWVKQNNIPKVDFIKADIEGAERLMLEGAQWVLKTYAPKLAICTYHLPDDKEVLTKLILQANPDYKIEYAWKKLYAWVEK
jgi:FkbM family methyltransferase